jgi:hypothetical protein
MGRADGIPGSCARIPAIPRDLPPIPNPVGVSPRVALPGRVVRRKA